MDVIINYLQSRFHRIAFTVGKSKHALYQLDGYNGDTHTCVTCRILIILHKIYHISSLLLSELSTTVDFPTTLIVTAQVWLTARVSCTLC